MRKREDHNLPLIVDMNFFMFYKGIYPEPQENKKKIKNRKKILVGDLIQSSAYEDLIKDFDEAYYKNVFGKK